MEPTEQNFDDGPNLVAHLDDDDQPWLVHSPCSKTLQCSLCEEIGYTVINASFHREGEK
jgi:hypothetical protein